MTVVVIEQMAAQAMRCASAMTVLDRSVTAYSGSVNDAAAAQALQLGYLGHAPQTNADADPSPPPH